MKKKELLNHYLAVMIVLPAILLLSGCAGTKKAAITMQPGFNPYNVDQITVLPIADLRFDKSDNLDMSKVDSWMLSTIEKRLKKYGYKTEYIDDRALVADLTEDDISEAGAWLGQVAPQNSNWILICGLVDSESRLTFGSTGNAEVTGYLYNIYDGSIIWHDKGVGKVGQGGLLGMAMKGFMTHDAIQSATWSLMASFPEFPK